MKMTTCGPMSGGVGGLEKALEREPRGCGMKGGSSCDGATAGGGASFLNIIGWQMIGGTSREKRGMWETCLCQVEGE